MGFSNKSEIKALHAWAPILMGETDKLANKYIACFYTMTHVKRKIIVSQANHNKSEVSKGQVYDVGFLSVFCDYH